MFFPVSCQTLEGKAYRLQHPWVGVVNRSQADINKSVDMIAARRREREYFATSPDYKHLAARMGSEYLGQMLSKVVVCQLKRLLRCFHGNLASSELHMFNLSSI